MKISCIDTKEQEEGLVKVFNVVVEKHINTHSYAQIHLMLYNWSDDSKYQAMMGDCVGIEDKENVFMWGTITKIETEYNFNNIFIIIYLTSLSLASDIDLHRRVFQSTDKKWSDIFSKIKTDKVVVEVEQGSFKDVVYEDIVVQSNQTDFDFVLQTAKKLGYYVFIKDTNKDNSKLVVAKFLNQSTVKIDEEDKTIVLLKKIQDGDMEHVHITLKKYIKIGNKVQILGHVYTAVKVVIEEKDDLIIKYSYILSRMLEEKEQEYFDNNVYNLGNCKVVSRDDKDNLGRLQVDFLDYEDVLSAEKKWISYLPNLTEKDVGVLFYPDEGEIVKVVSQDKQVFAIGCVRENAINDTFADTKNRTIKLREKLIVFSDDMINVEVDKSKIEIKKEQIVLLTEDIESTANKKIVQQSNDIEVASKSKIELKANASINAKTSKFNVTNG